MLNINKIFSDNPANFNLKKALKGAFILYCEHYLLTLTGCMKRGGSMKPYTPPGSSNSSTHLMPAAPRAQSSEPPVTR